MTPSQPLRHLVLILGDQLDADSSAFAGFDPGKDAVLMIEAREESTHVWSHQARTALFLSAMRHFGEQLQRRGWAVIYRKLEEHGDASLGQGLIAAYAAHPAERVIGVEPGDWRVRQHIENAVRALPVRVQGAGDSGPHQSTRCALEWREDTHFLCSLPEFRAWAGHSKTLRMEFFYRMMRQKTGVLMTDRASGKEPLGGQWNFDADNRKSFGKAGPQNLPAPLVFEPDTITRQVLQVVGEQFAHHPGSLTRFNWPVTREQALQALHDFISHRLPFFGPHQDAMWTGLDFGWHSLLSSSLNLKLLHPLEVIQAAERAYHERGLELASVEGFIRQILGWREFMRGVYFTDMPQLAQANHYQHHNALPAWYWTGRTSMACMRESIRQTLINGYSHHIQRLMVTGMFGVIAQISPQALCDWYLAVYVDAVEWVELPNTAGMALFANGGRFTSKPYIASGAYVKRMSNYCQGCSYSPEQRTGDNACPITTLYWNFLDRHESEFASNPRTALMAKNLQKINASEREAIRYKAQSLLARLDAL